MSNLGARTDELMKVRPSPSMLVALMALFVAFSGNAIGAGGGKLPPNSVGSREIKTGAVKGSELATNSVVGPKIRGGAVGAGDLAPGSVGPTTLAANAVTPPA